MQDQDRLSPDILEGLEMQDSCASKSLLFTRCIPVSGSLCGQYFVSSYRELYTTELDYLTSLPCINGGSHGL